MRIKNFRQFNESVYDDKNIGEVNKDIEIRFDIDSTHHTRTDSKFRKGIDKSIKDQDIIDLVEKSIEHLTIDLMRGNIDIKKAFVIMSEKFSIVCELRSGEENFTLRVRTLWHGNDIKLYNRQYVYDVDEDQAYIFNRGELEMISELNHQMTGAPLGVNEPGFGQGTHYGNWGADFGNPSQGVRGTFGKKQGNERNPQLPKGSGDAFPSVIYDPTTGGYLHEEDVIELVRQYEVKSQQNSEVPQKFDRVDSRVISFIKDYLSED